MSANYVQPDYYIHPDFENHADLFDAISLSGLELYVEQQNNLSPVGVAWVFMAIKYVWRAGKKPNTPYEKDIHKARECLLRACRKNGDWVQLAWVEAVKRLRLDVHARQATLDVEPVLFWF